MAEMKDKESKFIGKYLYGCGRRKRATARVRLYEGAGIVMVNDKSWQNYFSTTEMKEKVVSPLRATGNVKRFDVSIKVAGGGLNAQAEACRHGISRALITGDENLRGTLKPLGYLKRDPREKERKKPGLKRARRAKQFSKR